MEQTEHNGARGRGASLSNKHFLRPHPKSHRLCQEKEHSLLASINYCQIPSVTQVHSHGHMCISDGAV